MKKIILSVFISLSIFLLCACSLGNSNDPKETVKDFLDKYKNQDSDVISDLDETISSEYTGENKERYKNLMINQYKNMEYKITDEIIDGNTAVVTADVTVYNYGSMIDNANEYLKEHEQEFYKDEEKKEFDNDKFLDYKLDQLEQVEDRKTYTIEFTLTKDNNEWKLDDLSNENISKLHGIYYE